MQIGLSVTMGTKVKRLGATLSTFYHYQNWQAGTAFRAYYNWDSYGPTIRRPEYQISLAVSGAFGKSEEWEPVFFHLLSHQSQQRYAVGYAYNIYLDRSCPQTTGTIAIQLGRIEVITENDAFAGQGKDRFRTGALQVAWLHEQSRFALSSILWTGDPQHVAAQRVYAHEGYPCRFGYKDISATPFGRWSHGILVGEVRHQMGGTQVVSARLGIDAEQVRHALQNRLIHDGFTLPNRISGIQNPHLPMLDEQGCPYLFEPDQRLRRVRFWGDSSLNAPPFY